MRNSDVISGIFWIVVGFLLTFLSTHYEIGSLIQPGSGFLPLSLGILIILLSCVVLVQARKSFRPTQTAPFSIPRSGWKKVALAVFILLLAIFMFERIGYLLTIFFLIVFLMVGTGRQTWRTVLLVALFSTAGVYVVFVLLLKQMYPRGFLGI